MSKVMEDLERELEALLKVMDGLDEKTSEMYSDLTTECKMLGEILIKGKDLEQKDEADKRAKELEKAKLDLERSKVDLERERVSLERERILSEERKASEKNEADLKKSKLEATVKIVGIGATVLAVVLGVLFGIQVLSVEKVATVSCRSALNLAARFLTAKPMFV